MNKDIETPLNNLVDELAKTPYRLHYVNGLPSHLWMEFKKVLTERMKVILQPEREIPLPVSCNFVETEQIALKLICELYDALNSDKDLAYRLSPEYRKNYVAIS